MATAPSTAVRWRSSDARYFEYFRTFKYGTLNQVTLVLGGNRDSIKHRFQNFTKRGYLYRWKMDVSDESMVNCYLYGRTKKEAHRPLRSENTDELYADMDFQPTKGSPPSVLHEWKAVEYHTRFHHALAASKEYELTMFHTRIAHLILRTDGRRSQKTYVNPDRVYGITKVGCEDSWPTKNYFLEVEHSNNGKDDEKTLDRQREKCQQYITYRQSGIFQLAWDMDDFRVQFVTTTARKAVNLAARIYTTFGSDSAIFRVTDFHSAVTSPLGRIWIVPERSGTATNVLQVNPLDDAASWADRATVVE